MAASYRDPKQSKQATVENIKSNSIGHMDLGAREDVVQVLDELVAEENGVEANEGPRGSAQHSTAIGGEGHVVDFVKDDQDRGNMAETSTRGLKLAGNSSD